MPPTDNAVWSAISRTELKEYLDDEVIDEESTIIRSSLEYKTLYGFLNTYSLSYTEGYIHINDHGEVYDISIRDIILPLDFTPYDSTHVLRERFIINVKAINDFIEISRESERIESTLKNHSLILKSQFN